MNIIQRKNVPFTKLFHSKKFDFKKFQTNTSKYLKSNPSIPSLKLSKASFFKITNEKENHYGFQYKNGLNILKEEFKWHTNKGGFHFTTLSNIHHFLDLGCNLREIKIPINVPNIKIANVSTHKIQKWKTDHIYLTNKYSLNSVETYKKFDLNRIEFLKWNVIHGNANILEFLLKNNSYYQDPEFLQLALYSKNPANVKILIDAGFDFHYNEEYVMRHAASLGYIDIVKYVIKKGANVHAQNDFAFHASYKAGHIETAQFLIDKGSYIH